MYYFKNQSLHIFYMLYPYFCHHKIIFYNHVSLLLYCVFTSENSSEAIEGAKYIRVELRDKQSLKHTLMVYYMRPLCNYAEFPR